MLLECAYLAGTLWIKTGEDEYTEFSQFYRVERYKDTVYMIGYSRDFQADLQLDLVNLTVPAIMDNCEMRARARAQSGETGD